MSKPGDVFALDASVSDNSGAYSSWASCISVRGLPLDWQNACRIDGKPFLSYTITLPDEHFEQIASATRPPGMPTIRGCESSSAVTPR